MIRLDRRTLGLGVAASVAARFAGASVFAAEQPPNRTFIDLLGMIPASAASVAPGQLAAFADIAGQLAAAGVTPPAGPNASAGVIDAWTGAVRALAGPSITDRGGSTEWLATFGFDVFAIDQSLEFGELPLALNVFRGRFNSKDIGSALQRSGYTEVDRPGAAVWSLHGDESISLDIPANRLALARMNNVASVGDRLLLAATRLDALDAMLETIAGKRPSMASDGEMLALLRGVPNPLASCLILTGDAVLLNPRDVKLLLAGVTYGAAGAPRHPPAAPGGERPSHAKWDLAVLTTSEASAAALAAAIPANLRSGRSLATQAPLTDYFSDWTVEALSNEPIVTVEITFAPDRDASLWLRFVSQRDLGFLSVP